MVQERNFWMLVLLSIVTCGIYAIYFWYVYANDMNKVCEGDGKETTNYLVVFLLSIITCGIYQFIWFYQVGNRMQENAPRYGLSFQENGTSILLWMLLGSLICGIGMYYAWYLMIKNMNALGAAYNSPAARQQ